MNNLIPKIQGLSLLSKDANTSALAKAYFMQAIAQRHIDYAPDEYFENTYKAPYTIADLKIAHCPSWVTLAIESYDIFYSDKYYNYDDAGLLNDDKFFYHHITWREGPYQNGKVKIRQGDVIIDCGANMGLFTLMAVKSGASKVYAYEPVPQTIDLLKENVALNEMSDKVIVKPYGLYSENKTLKFTTEDLGANCISDKGDVEVECVSLDSDITEKVDFIKADIEGAERDMLNGATDILKKYAPKLSLCIYHKSDDKKVMTRIIKKANSNYKFRYTPWKLYAWVD